MVALKTDVDRSDRKALLLFAFVGEPLPRHLKMMEAEILEDKHLKMMREGLKPDKLEKLADRVRNNQF